MRLKTERKKTEKSRLSLRDTIKWANIDVKGVSKGREGGKEGRREKKREREREAERRSEEIMVVNCPNLMKDII